MLEAWEPERPDYNFKVPDMEKRLMPYVAVCEKERAV
jgi:hypothetical protein